jgi:hypothetical protein
VKLTSNDKDLSINELEHDERSAPRGSVDAMHSDAASSPAAQRVLRARRGFKLRDLTRAVSGTIKAGLPVRCIEIEFDSYKIRLQIQGTDRSENAISDDANDWSDAK